MFLARTGKTIHDVSFVNLDADGNVQPPPSRTTRGAEAHRARAAPKASRSSFPTATGRSQTLYYFSTNLADDGVKRSGFLAFCAKLGVADSFVKSASYLLHCGGFTQVRNFMLDHSATILQDDSGIPLPISIASNGGSSRSATMSVRFRIFPHAYQAQMAELFGTERHPARLRHRLPVAQERIESAAGAADRAATG